MINGAHFLLYSTDADADRAFFRDVLGFASVDAGGGWLIFKLPASELAVHPGDPGAPGFVQRHAEHEVLGAILYLMCNDVAATVESLKARDVRCAPIDEAEWGRYTLITLPSGGRIGLYEPSHPTAIGLD